MRAAPRQGAFHPLPLRKLLPPCGRLTETVVSYRRAEALGGTMPKVKPAEEMSYEQAFQELEATVHRIEAGELPLEQALALFERGQALATRCNDLLDQAELKLRKLMPDERGGFTEADLDLEEESR